jgi:predicted GIY-YIG superfamily endonuclease
MPSEALAKEGSLHYVYHIQSLRFPQRVYTGYTDDLRQRLADHNRGGCDFTRPFRPWQLISYLAFSDPDKARAFEAYLKTGSGIAFARKRLW